MERVRIETKRAVPGILLAVGLVLWFARWPPDCKQAAQPLIDALERYRETHGFYPASLDSLIREDRLQSIPRPTWNLGVLHSDTFDYGDDPDLDYYYLGYAEQGRLATHWYGVYYVSFRGAWDDSPGVPKCDLFGLPLDRAGNLFQKSRSSKDLRWFIDIAAHKENKDLWPLYSEDVTQAVGDVSPCTMDGRAGYHVEAGDEEAAAFRFITNPAPGALTKHEVIRILEREREGTEVRWREVFRAS